MQHWKGPRRRTSQNRLFYRWECFQRERSTCPGTLGNSGPEPALNFLLASVLRSFKDLAGWLPSAQVHSATKSPRQGSFFPLPFQIQPLDSRGTSLGAGPLKGS